MSAAAAPDPLTIRDLGPDDIAALEALYPAAFPDEDLLPVVRDLRAESDGVLELMALRGTALVGHVAFTSCAVPGSSQTVALLAPLAVAPDAQRAGVGSALVGEGLDRLRSMGVAQVNVLGDPAYYGRFGFTADRRIAPPYDLPQDWATAWQCLSLSSATPAEGRLHVPPAWRDPKLWGP
jgi:putative acetyltransferase